MFIGRLIYSDISFVFGAGMDNHQITPLRVAWKALSDFYLLNTPPVPSGDPCQTRYHVRTVPATLAEISHSKVDFNS